MYKYVPKNGNWFPCNTVKYVVINAVNTVMIDKKTPHPRAIIE